MDIDARYQSKLTTPDQAVASIPSGSRLSMGMAMAEPPALLRALADRAEAGKVENVRLYYYEATSIAGKTVLRYELNDILYVITEKRVKGLRDYKQLFLSCRYIFG